MYSHFQLQTPVCVMESLIVFPDNEMLKQMENAWYFYAIYRAWEEYRTKQTLKSLLLR